MKLILASGSPRRRELMEMLCPKDLEIVPAVGEEAADPALPPDALVKALSRHKAEEIAADDFGFVADIGLKENLSPTRANGLVSMIETIKNVARNGR